MNSTLGAATLFAAASALLAQPADIGTPLGQLIDIGGRNLHFHCTGSGAPTVILEAGASSFAIDWALVQPELARSHRVCSYDRAGFGWSDARPGTETPAKIVADLHAGLAAIAEKPPFLLVGASFGAIYARTYHLDYPSEVVAMVLVDPATEDRLFTKFEGRTVTIGSLTAEQFASTFPAAGPIPVPSRPVQRGAPFDRLPGALYEARLKLDQRLIESMPSSITADFLREYQEGQRAALARLLDSRSNAKFPIGDRPLVVLTRGDGQTPGIEENHAGLARLSTNSRHTVVEGSGHEIHLYAPKAVIQAVLDASQAARLHRGLATH